MFCFESVLNCFTWNWRTLHVWYIVRFQDETCYCFELFIVLSYCFMYCFRIRDGKMSHVYQYQILGQIMYKYQMFLTSRTSDFDRHSFLYWIYLVEWRSLFLPIITHCEGTRRVQISWYTLSKPPLVFLYLSCWTALRYFSLVYQYVTTVPENRRWFVNNRIDLETFNKIY